MAIELDSTGDFAAVVDGWEPVTLQRRESAETVAVARALRFSTRTEEADAAGGHVASQDVVWQFEWPSSDGLPRLGDAIVDAGGDCWTILAVKRRGGGSRVECQSRNLHLVYELTDRVDVQQAVWDESGDVAEIVGWTTLWTSLPARIQPYRTTVDAGRPAEEGEEGDLGEPPSSVAQYHVILGQQIELDHNHRLVDPRGVVYRVVQFAQAERIDVLPIATVEREEDET